MSIRSLEELVTHVMDAKDFGSRFSLATRLEALKHLRALDIDQSGYNRIHAEIDDAVSGGYPPDPKILEPLISAVLENFVRNFLRNFYPNILESKIDWSLYGRIMSDIRELDPSHSVGEFTEEGVINKRETLLRNILVFYWYNGEKVTPHVAGIFELSSLLKWKTTSRASLRTDLELLYTKHRGLDGNSVQDTMTVEELVNQIMIAKNFNNKVLLRTRLGAMKNLRPFLQSSVTFDAYQKYVEEFEDSGEQLDEKIIDELITKTLVYFVETFEPQKDKNASYALSVAVFIEIDAWEEFSRTPFAKMETHNKKVDIIQKALLLVWSVGKIAPGCLTRAFSSGHISRWSSEDIRTFRNLVGKDFEESEDPISSTLKKADMFGIQGESPEDEDESEMRQQVLVEALKLATNLASGGNTNSALTEFNRSLDKIQRNAF